jgi:uncharacterized iron-regulated membrane protein/NAD(P)-dependent dehydrogenase (short-subunit alcohol dehydrogenase family)
MSEGRLYRTIWRWHFYAALLVVPMVLVLALTGSIYLFKPQLDRWEERDFRGLSVAGAVSPNVQLEAALAAVPGASFYAYRLPEAAGDAAMIHLGRPDGHGMLDVYVSPQGKVLGSVDPEQRISETIKRLHGSLMIGRVGDWLVELAASWAIVMIATGLYLWWPRGRGLAGVIWPRLRSGRKLFWRDLHAVTGFWVAGLALVMLLTGLPWAGVWATPSPRRAPGSGSSRVRRTGRPARRPCTPTTIMPRWPTRAPRARTSQRCRCGSARPRRAALPFPVLVLPPGAPQAFGPPTGKVWTVKSEAQNRPLMETLTFDPATGQELTHERFADKHPLDRLVQLRDRLARGPAVRPRQPADRCRHGGHAHDARHQRLRHVASAQARRTARRPAASRRTGAAARSGGHRARAGGGAAADGALACGHAGARAAVPRAHAGDRALARLASDGACHARLAAALRAHANDEPPMTVPSVLVTGGAKRIGAAISRRFAAAGWHVVIHCNRSLAQAEALAAELPSAETVRCDLADGGAALVMIESLAERLDDWRALVNSASVFRPDDVAQLDVGTNWEALQVNAAIPAMMAQAYLRLARSAAGRRVIQVTDQKLANPNPDFFSYTMSKHALAATVPMLAMAAAPGDRIYALAPGRSSPATNSPTQMPRRPTASTCSAAAPAPTKWPRPRCSSPPARSPAARRCSSIPASTFSPSRAT